MSVPFSNTHLRVPCGFGTILEGLTREILRDQPEDIPTYAAKYFDTLLKQREESGMDPAEWAAKLEDRFYNNHAFKASYSTCCNHKCDVQSDELTGSEEEKDQTVDQAVTTGNEKGSRPVLDEDIPDSELELTDLASFNANADVCAQELGVEEDEGGQAAQTQDTAAGDEELRDLEEEKGTEMEKSREVFLYSGLADVDVCAEELGKMDQTTEETEADEPSDTQATEQEISVLQIEETEDNAFGQMPVTEDGLESHAKPKEETFIEINFEDVPEAQGITEVWEKEEVPQTNVSVIQQHEESTEFTEQGEDHNIHSTKDHGELEMEGVVKEVNSDREKMTMQQEASDTMKEKLDTSDSDSNDSVDDENEKGVKNSSFAHQPTAETEENNPEDQTKIVLSDENYERISEAKSHRHEELEREKTKYESDKEDKMADMVGEDKEDTQDPSEMENTLHLEMNDGDRKINLSQVTQSNTSKAGMAAESETLETSTEHLAEESDEQQRTLVKPQTENTVEEIEVTSEHPVSSTEEIVEEGQIDSKVQESGVMWEEGSVIPIHSADWMDLDKQEQQRPTGSEKNTTESESKTNDEVINK
ncbi:hypothetical protein LDENG_00271750 [Lucifuga dentata]|nr:hypothetical protein LDENG_00271750 [Lucifuga dentata]